MLDRKQACQVLGLTEDATPRQIEERYFLLVKKYKRLAPDEQPSPGEPIFSVINEAYRFLTGYAPLQKVRFEELNWKEKIGHIREHYMAEIVFVLMIVLFCCAVGIGFYELNQVLRAGPEEFDPFMDSPHPGP